MMPILGYLKVTNFNEELDVCNGVANKTLKHILSQTGFGGWGNTPATLPFYHAVREVFP
jgi:hypothetical protein